jgi:aryl-alcohol dehydrogenase-like predicted oxidoreductase
MFADHGGTFVDTSNIYAYWIPGFVGGESETVIGEWMTSRHMRDRMVVATKVGFGYQDCGGGLRAADIERECERSLRRLGTETIDVYYAHCEDPTTPVEETLQAFHRLVDAGKVRCVGASNWQTWRLAEARVLSDVHGWASHSVYEFRHTYLRPDLDADFGAQIVASPDLLEYCSVRGIPLVAYSVLLNGAYTRSERSLDGYGGPDNLARLAILHAVAEDLQVTPNQVVIAWMLNSVLPVIPIIGASTLRQLEENLQATVVQLTDEHVQRLNSATA